jgi:ribosome-associated protein
MEQTQELVLHPEAVNPEIAQTPTLFADLDPEVQLAIQSAADKKAFDLLALDLRDIASFAEFFIISSGANQRQVQAIADEIGDQLKAQLSTRPVRIEGYGAGEWVLMDYGDFIVHIFNKESRDFYDLARLWRDARPVTLPAL